MDFMGGICLFGGSFAPRDWAFCNGQLMPISQNQALYAILGTIWGGDGRTSFALPDMRSRVPIGVGRGPGLTQAYLGQQRGREYVLLTTNNLPVHAPEATFTPTGGSSGSPLTATVTVNANSSVGNKTNATDNFWATTPGGLSGEITYSDTADTVMNTDAVQVAISGGGGGITGGTVTVHSVGGDMPFPTWSPNLGIHYIIMTQGVFPARN